MEPFDKDIDKRKQKDSFDISNENEFERISSEIQKMFESFCFIEMLGEIRRDKFRENKWFTYNFIIKTQVLEGPKSRKFDSYPLKITPRLPLNSRKDKSTFDIIGGDNEVTITIEMPDVKKGDISLRVTRDSIEIIDTKPMREYYRLINLPCSVKSKTAKATYRNGVLDIIIRRENKRESGVIEIEKE